MPTNVTPVQQMSPPEAAAEFIQRHHADPRQDPLVGLAAADAERVAGALHYYVGFGAWCRRLADAFSQAGPPPDPFKPADPTGRYRPPRRLSVALAKMLLESEGRVRVAHLLLKSLLAEVTRREGPDEPIPGLLEALERGRVVRARNTGRPVELPYKVFAADLAFFWLHTDRGRLTGRSLALASRATMVCDYAGDPERRWGRYLRLARAELGRFDPTDDATVSPMTACIFDALGNPPPGFEGDAVSDPAALVSHLLDRD